VEDQKKLEATLAVEVDSARARISEIQTELESVIEQLGEAKVLLLLTLLLLLLLHYYYTDTSILLN